MPRVPPQPGRGATCLEDGMPILTNAEFDSTMRVVAAATAWVAVHEGVSERFPYADLRAAADLGLKAAVDEYLVSRPELARQVTDVKLLREWLAAR